MYWVRLWRIGGKWVVCLLKGVNAEEIWVYREPVGAFLMYLYLKARAALGIL